MFVLWFRDLRCREWQNELFLQPSSKAQKRKVWVECCSYESKTHFFLSSNSAIRGMVWGKRGVCERWQGIVKHSHERDRNRASERNVGAFLFATFFSLLYLGTSDILEGQYQLHLCKALVILRSNVLTPYQVRHIQLGATEATQVNQTWTIFPRTLDSGCDSLPSELKVMVVRHSDNKFNREL